MDPGELEKFIGHTFRTPELLERALTHRSWANEHNARHNETLEFLGDAVVGLAVVEDLFLRFPDLREGELSVMKHRLVSTTTLAVAGKRVGLAEFIRFSSGEEKIGGRRNPTLLANTFEAVTGAIFLDAGYEAARAFVTRVLADELRGATPAAAVDYKSLLQERLQANKMSAPSYKLVRTDGQPHDRTFFVEAVWETGRSSGEGRSRKAAEMMAAYNALMSIGVQENERD